MPASEESAKRWLGKLTSLNPATGRGECRGKAPHKPLLLLCLLDMTESGEFPTRVFSRSPGLVLRFRSYGALVVGRWPSRLDLKMPFFHLKTQNFWDAFDAGMQPAVSPDHCAVCEMNADFFELLGDAGFRLKARLVLIAKYFEPLERVALLESLGIQASERRESSSNRLKEDAEEFAKRKGRSARFSVRVCSEYRFTCALTGYRCIAGSEASIVDAAHIEPWRENQNDDPANGLALSKNAHWMFDEGLWAVDDHWRIVVNARTFTENGPEALRLSSYSGRHLQFDPAATMRPSLEFLRRHRQSQLR